MIANNKNDFWRFLKIDYLRRWCGNRLFDFGRYLSKEYLDKKILMHDKNINYKMHIWYVNGIPNLHVFGNKTLKKRR